MCPDIMENTKNNLNMGQFWVILAKKANSKDVIAADPPSLKAMARQAHAN